MPVTVTEIWRYPVSRWAVNASTTSPWMSAAWSPTGCGRFEIQAGLDNDRTTPVCAAEVRRPIRWGPTRKSSSCCRRRGDLERRSGGACPAFGAGRQRGPARADTSSFR